MADDGTIMNRLRGNGHGRGGLSGGVLIASALGAAALAAGTAYAVKQVRNVRKNRPPDSAPGRTAKGGEFGDYAVVGRTVTINKPRAELYAFWRDFRNLGQFMENVEKVEPHGDTGATWVIAAPAGQSVTLETEILQDRPDELIAWRSVEGSDIEAEGRVTFRDAPNGRGTRVEAIIAYKPPAGAIGQLIAKLFRREPSLQGRHELKRFKMLMETGEIATPENRRQAA